MRRRAALLLLPLALVIWFLRPRVPTDHALAIHFGSRAQSVREADLYFQHEGDVAHDVKLYFPTGAPSDVTRTVRLAAGDYEVGVRMVMEGGEERHVARAVHVEGEKDLEVNLEVK